MKEKFLPIGSVVLLKGGKKELMITGYCIIPNGQEIVKDSENELNMRDYCACTYPEGIINSDVAYAFDHNQIDKMCFMGYETEASKQVSKSITDNIEEVKKAIVNEIKQK